MPPQSRCDTRRRTAVKHILQYIAGTRSYDCHYAKKLEGLRFVGYSDSNMADDVNDVKFQELRTRIGVVEIKKTHQGLGGVC